MTYDSTLTTASASAPGVRLTVHRVSVGRRLELLKRVRELTSRLEFYKAGTQLEDQLESSIASAEIEALYVVWGIAKIENLTIDDSEATPELLVSRGPEDLVREAATLVRSQLCLNENERKN